MKTGENVATVHTHTHTHKQSNRTKIGVQNYKNGFKTIVENDRSFLMQKSGITLIALVVTIIVLIILAAVSLNLILGQNGIISRAQQASKETKLSAFKEQVEMDVQDVLTGLIVDRKTNVKPDDEEFKNKIHDDKGYNVTDNGDGTITLEKDGGTATVNPDWTVEVEGVPNYNLGGTGETETPPTEPGDNNEEEEEEELFAIKSIKELKPGDYIDYTVSPTEFSMSKELCGYDGFQQYFDTSKYEGYWQILYDFETNGVTEIISSGSVLDNNTGGANYVLYMAGLNGWNNLSDVLTFVASYYVNPLYALSSRNLGTDPQVVRSNNWYSNPDDYFQRFAGSVIDQDVEYVRDLNTLIATNQLIPFNPNNAYASTTYWFDSRFISNR